MNKYKMSNSSWFQLFQKLTSQRPEVRVLTTYMINEDIRDLPCWYNLIGMGMGNSNLAYVRKYHMNITEKFRLILKKKFMLKQKGVYSVNFDLFNVFNEPLIVIYTFARWKAFTAKTMLPFQLDGNRVPLLRLLKKKVGLADVYCDMGRIKSFTLSDAIIYSYCRDIRFVLFLCIFFGFSLWMFIAPEPLFQYPNGWFSPTFLNVIKDTDVNHLCLTHPEVLSPCECGEPFNQTVRERFPQKDFDPDQKHSGKLFTCSLMVATLILSLALTESVSQYGLFLPLGI